MNDIFFKGKITVDLFFNKKDYHPVTDLGLKERLSTSFVVFRGMIKVVIDSEWSSDGN